mgnify:CR=1 FL=1
MTRFHTTAEGDVPFTAEEEALRDQEEAAFAAEAPARATKAALDAIEATFSETVKAITAGYSEDEVKSWATQVMEANSTGSTPMIDAISRTSGVAKPALIARIQANAAAYAAAYGEALGAKQAAIIKETI